MSSIFVSHASADATFVQREILPLLTARRVTPWYSTHSIGGATEWERSILVGLKDSDWFLLVLSPAAIRSEWVRTETTWAFQNRAGRIIPVLAETCEAADLNLRLLDLQAIDFRSDTRSAGSRLTEALEVLRSAGHLSGGTQATIEPAAPKAPVRQSVEVVGVASTRVDGRLNYGEPIQSAIQLKGETHIYSVDARAGDSLVFRLTDTDGAGGRAIGWEPCLEVFDSRGVSVARAVHTGRASIGPLTVPIQGTWSIAASHNDAAGGDRYEGRGGYQLWVQRLNNPGAARSIGASELLRSRIDMKGVVHTYVVTLEKGDRIRATVIRWGRDGVYPLIEAYDPDGNLLDQVHGHSPVGEPPPATIDYTANMLGQHCLLVSAYIHFDLGHYELRVERGAPPEVSLAPPDLSKLGIELAQTVTDVPTPGYVYIADRCQHFDKRTEAGFVKTFGGAQMLFGERLRVMESEHAHLLAEAYDGRTGYIAKDLIQERDPKTYFASVIAGRPVVGFLLGPHHCDYLRRLRFETKGGAAEIPTHQIQLVYATAEFLAVLDSNDNEYIAHVDEWKKLFPGRFTHGKWPGIKSGHGTVLPLTVEELKKLGEPLVIRRLKVTGG